jgi:hypothetical protein
MEFIVIIRVSIVFVLSFAIADALLRRGKQMSENMTTVAAFAIVSASSLICYFSFVIFIASAMD